MFETAFAFSGVFVHKVKWGDGVFEVFDVTEV